MTFNQIQQLLEEAKKISGQKDTYELELELEGGMTFRLDIKDLDKLMIKLQTLGNTLGGSK